LELPARQRRRGVSGRSGVRAAGVGLVPPSTREPGEAVAPADDLGELVEELVDPFVTGGRQCGEGLRQIADPELRECLESLAAKISGTSGAPTVDTVADTPIPVTFRSER